MDNKEENQSSIGNFTPEQLASSSLLSYIGLHYPKYNAEGMHKLIATALEAVEAGKIRRLLINCPPQHGKPAYEEEFVLMGDGSYKKLKDIQIGDYIITHKRRPKKVLKIYEQGELPTIQLNTQFGRNPCTAKDHPFLTILGWVEAGKLKINDTLIALQNQSSLYYSPDPITSIENTGMRKCRCLFVEDDHSFTIQNIVVHNTMLASEFFPAWLIGRHPDWKIIATTYSQTKANEVGTVVRDTLVGNIHRRIFPDCEVSPLVRSTQHVATTQRGHYYSVGVGGAQTGRGANCLTGETLITVKIDNVVQTLSIAAIYELKDLGGVQILSFDHNKNVATFKNIIATRKEFTKELYEITTNSGNYIRSTGEHRFFVSGRGYINAKDLWEGDRLTTNKITKQQNMYKLRETKKWERAILQRMLYRTSESRNRDSVYMVWEKNNQKSTRNTKSDKKRPQRSILFSGMFDAAPCNKEQKKMYSLWEANPKKNSEILFGSMQTNCKRHQETKANRMPILWKIFSSEKQPATILQPRVCKQSTFTENDWGGQLPLQRWNELCYAVSQNETFYPKTRRCQMFSMQQVYGIKRDLQKRMVRSTNKEQFSCTSYRRRSNKQYTRKSDIPLYDLPCSTPQIESDTISSVRRISTEKIPVYDIQVEEANNFFANEILVHNCFIIDDPIKGSVDAESKLSQKKLRDWYRTVAYTRLRPDNRIIIIQTRWTDFDLTGFVLEEHLHENWTTIKLRAVAEDDDILKRKAGDALCPNMYSKEYLDNVKIVEGTYNWEALYQQRPVAKEGGIIKYEWIEDNYYDKLPTDENIVKTVISWDTAYRKDELNDPTAATIWKITNNGYYLIDVFNDKLEFYQIIRKVIELDSKYHPTAHLIEGRASGQPIIDELRRKTALPVIEVSTKNLDKEVRLGMTTGLFESGKVHLPNKAPWLVETRDQLCLLPSYKYDDIADSISHFLNWVNKPRYVRRPPNKLYWK